MQRQTDDWLNSVNKEEEGGFRMLVMCSRCEKKFDSYNEGQTCDCCNKAFCDSCVTVEDDKVSNMRLFECMGCYSQARLGSMDASVLLMHVATRVREDWILDPVFARVTSDYIERVSRTLKEKGR